MVTCLFPRKREENTEILNTYLSTLYFGARYIQSKNHRKIENWEIS